MKLENNSIFQKLDFSNVMNWILAILGIVGGIVSACFLNQPGFWTALVGVLAAQVLIGISWSWTLWIKHKTNVEKESIELENIDLKEKIAELQTKIETQKNEYAKLHQTELERIESISTLFKNLSKLNNDFCIKIPGIAEHSYHLLETMSKTALWETEAIETEVKSAYKDFAVGLFDIFKRYSSNALGYLVDIEEAYLRIKGYNHTVTATIKLFNTPFYPTKMRRDEIVVYTAYRNKKAYDKKEREIGEIAYTIDGNVDFGLCLKKEQFIINNATRDTESYSNEHIDFDGYYNCAAVVPIRTKLPDSSYVFYGYMCCDCLNNGLDEIFDATSARFLFAIAQQYALFLDTLETNWNDRVEEIPDVKKYFLENIYEATFTGRKTTK